jgi:signal transduction histidine kinase
MLSITQRFEKEEKITDETLLNKTDEFGVLVEKYNQLYDSLKQETQLNSKLLEENKRFIADTVHQIRTPLTNIMMNGEMVKLAQKDASTAEYIDQIDASINMLSNSYEDLAYLTSYNTIEYKASKVSLSDILHKRIRFFKTIATVNFKDFSIDIVPNIEVEINEIELERLIDNNLSNAIKYASHHKPITVNLSKMTTQIVLTFQSYGTPIGDKEKIFEKNYRENDSKRGLGLGLNMVKNICDKYHISYRVTFENGQNIFQYFFDKPKI